MNQLDTWQEPKKDQAKDAESLEPRDAVDPRPGNTRRNGSTWLRVNPLFMARRCFSLSLGYLGSRSKKRKSQRCESEIFFDATKDGRCGLLTGAESSETSTPAELRRISRASPAEASTSAGRSSSAAARPTASGWRTRKTSPSPPPLLAPRRDARRLRESER